ncbi:MAG: DNA polymerase III subunit gamma/tau [Actinomycetota bacterium]|nr:DNA polymerase III subunit gamma/tau [Actinomycetota bacterium]
MRHVSLYRKWRPRTFDAVAGQEPVVRTLSRAIETDRVAHAYLFSGPRGTGKTSTAKVLAMGLNCEKGPTPEPDGTCESCRAIVNNSSMDVLEMDAASNRGIDEIRDLRDRVNLAPTQGRMKVYIIDEVHMLTTEAFNALLKMLEEPPEHVVFVLATTEKHKVLPTIISRCQSFDFRRPGVSLLAEKLREISEAEGIEIEPAALTLIAREGRGSFRDAEGLLDQLASFADGPITAARVRELLGSAGSEALLETTQALYERRAADALRVVDRLQNEGKDLSRFVGELVAHLRRLMLLPHAPEIALAEVGGEERAGLEEQASRTPTAEVVRMIEALGDSLSRAKRGGDQKLELELTFLKLARDYAEPSVDALLGRLETLEKAVANGAATVVLARPSRGEETGAENEEETLSAEAAPLEATSHAGEDRGGGEPGEAESGHDPEHEDGRDETIRAVAAQWGQVIQDLKDRKQALTATVFAEGMPSSLQGGVLEIAFPKESDFYAKEAGKSRHSEALGEVLERRFGVRPRLELRVAGADGSASANPPSPKTPAEVANDFAPLPSPHPSRDVPEVAPEAALKPEAETPQRATPDGVDAAPIPEAKDELGTEAGESAEADGTIQDQWEVLSMARELFGPGEGLPEGKRNEGS